VSLLRDLKNLLQELLILQRTLSGLEAKVDRLGEENVRLRQDLQAEVERLREHLALRDENLLLRLQQLLAERLLPSKRR
jgi:hypothetical protein